MRRIIGVWNRWGIRKQLTAASVVVAVLPMLAGVMVLANLLTSSLTNTMVSNSRDVANRVADQVDRDGVDELPGDLRINDAYRAQVLDSRGDVIWTSNPHFAEPVSDARPAPGKEAVSNAVYWWGPGDHEGQDLTVTRTTNHAGVDYYVMVATSPQGEKNAVRTAVSLLLACVPLVLLSAGLISWWVAGRALRPVDRMNSRVGQITSSTLDARLELPEAHDELRSLAITMNQMLERLDAAQQSQQRFVSDASHELRSPIAGLSGALQLATADDDLATWRDMAPLMTAEANRLEGLVHGLLTLSRGDDLGLNLAVGEVDLDDMASSEVQRLRASTSLRVTPRIAACRVEADAQKLTQVLRNLCDNAARHAASQIRVDVEALPDEAVLRVADDGNGIAVEDRERVFDRFVRLQESRTRDEGGSGLGLAITQQIVRAHGGSIAVVDDKLGGACFEVRLPRPVA